MSAGTHELEKRLQRMEDMLLQIAEKLELFPEETSQFGPRKPFTMELAKDYSSWLKRLSDVVFENFGIDRVLKKYMSQRIAYDNHLHRKVDAASESMASLEERLDYVELAAFPMISKTLSKTIGENARLADPKSAELDRCKFNPYRQRKG